MTNERPRFLSEKEAAEYLDMAPMTLYQMRKDPTKTRFPIPYIRLGNRIRYEERRLIAWLRAHEVNTMSTKNRVAATRALAPVKRGPGRPKGSGVAKRGPGRPKRQEALAAASVKKRKVKKK